MNATAADSLSQYFLKAHQHFIRGLNRIVECLERNDPRTAAQAALDLDRRSGPHVEFEETEFYPLLVQPLGQQFVSQLYREHMAGLDALRAILAHDQTASYSEEEQRMLVEKARIALDHATSCGTLLSHVAGLTEDHKQELLRHYRQIERRGRRWTELHAPPGSSSPN
jgi:hypothetical protein